MAYDSSAPIPGWPPQQPPYQQPPGQPPAGAQPTQPALPYQAPPPPYQGQPPFEGQYQGQPPYQGQAPYQGQPPYQPPPPAKRKVPLWAWITTGAVVVALIVGLIIWAPWSPPPNPVTALRVSSPTATSALISWSAPQGGGKPDQYYIWRDGKQVGTVAASQTSYTDNGLAPGSKHSYTVYTHGGGGQSKASAVVALTTLTPPPVNVKDGKRTYTSVQVTWSASPKGPAPTGYTVYDGSNSIGTVSGSVHGFTATGLTPGDSYQISVTEQWGATSSDPSAALSIATMMPPLSGTVPLHFHVTSVPSGSSGLTKQEGWDDTWQFSATCTASSCKMSASAELAPPDLKATPFTLALTQSGGEYKGSATAQFSSCGSVQDKDTVAVSIAPDTGKVVNGGWTAWQGALKISAPLTKPTSTTFCPAQSWSMTLSGTGGS